MDKKTAVVGEVMCDDGTSGMRLMDGYKDVAYMYSRIPFRLEEGSRLGTSLATVCERLGQFVRCLRNIILMIWRSVGSE